MTATGVAPLASELDDIRSRFLAAGLNPPALEPRIAALVRVALHAHVSLLDRDGMRVAVDAARTAGATEAEIVEVLVLTSAVGSHSLAIGVPMLLEELAEAGVEPDETPLDERSRTTRDAFTSCPVRPRAWAPMWEAVLRADPDYFAALAAYLDAPWAHGTLDALTREFVYIAVDVTATHLFPGGLRGHIRSALQLGASSAQVIAVMQVASTVADLSCTVGLPLAEARPSES